MYPLEDGDKTYDCYNLKIIYDREKTGYEQERELPIVINEVLAGRYQVIGVLGQAQFSKAIKVKDLTNTKYYCIKIRLIIFKIFLKIFLRYLYQQTVKSSFTFFRQTHKVSYKIILN